MYINFIIYFLKHDLEGFTLTDAKDTGALKEHNNIASVKEVGGVTNSGEEDGRVASTKVKARLGTHTLRAWEVELESNLAAIVKELSIGIRGGAVDLHSLSR